MLWYVDEKHSFSKIDLRAVVKRIQIYKRINYYDIKVHEQKDAGIFVSLKVAYCIWVVVECLPFYMCICLEDEYCLKLEFGQILVLFLADFYLYCLS